MLEDGFFFRFFWVGWNIFSKGSKQFEVLVGTIFSNPLSRIPTFLVGPHWCSPKKLPINIYIYCIYIYIHLHIHIYVYTYIFIYLEPNWPLFLKVRNLQPSPIWKGKWSSKPPWLCSMLIFRGVFPGVVVALDPYILMKKHKESMIMLSENCISFPNRPYFLKSWWYYCNTRRIVSMTWTYENLSRIFYRIPVACIVGWSLCFWHWS